MAADWLLASAILAIQCVGRGFDSETPRLVNLRGGRHIWPIESPGSVSQIVEVV